MPYGFWFLYRYYRMRGYNVRDAIWTAFVYRNHEPDHSDSERLRQAYDASAAFLNQALTHYPKEYGAELQHLSPRPESPNETGPA